MRTRLQLGLASAVLISAMLASASGTGLTNLPIGGSMHLSLRSRIQPFPATESLVEATFEQTIQNAQAAIIVTDMWDKHWCRGATARVREIANRMEPVLQKARAAGILIIHAPSETMGFYAVEAGRRLALDAPRATPPPELVVHDAPLPIDDSNGGCDTAGDTEHRAWSRQSPLLTIGQGDVISDDGAEIYNVLQQHNIRTLFYMGVHANMCILNRSFGIRQMTRWGMRCILVRDLTDAMYESGSRPYVSHRQGVELVVEYIERYWAPTVSSSQLLAELGK